MISVVYYIIISSQDKRHYVVIYTHPFKLVTFYVQNIDKIKDTLKGRVSLFLNWKVPSFVENI